MRILFSVLRWLIAVAVVVLLVLFIAPIVMYRILIIGNIAGIALCVWALVMCVPPLHHAVKRAFLKHTFTKVLYRVVNAVIVLFLIYGAAVTAAMAVTCLSAPPEDSTVLVLGAKVSNSGEPTLILRDRISAAEEYLTAHPKCSAVLTGGKGSDEVISEAECMYNTMVGDGIDPERLYLEDKATDTVENFAFSQKIIEENALNKNLAVVTDGFHQFRARIIAQKQGITSAIGSVNAHTRLVFIPTYAVREWFALPLLFFK